VVSFDEVLAASSAELSVSYTLAMADASAMPPLHILKRSSSRRTATLPI
jgi:hypothetical protein